MDRRGSGPVRTGSGPCLRRQRGGISTSLQDPCHRGHLYPVGRSQAPELVPLPLRSRRCRPPRASHLRLHVQPGRCRADQQLGGSGQHARRAFAAVQGIDARAHHVCDPVLHGATGLGPLDDRRPDHRFRLCGCQHEADGAYRSAGPACAWHGRIRALPALGQARLRPAIAMCRGLATRSTNIL